MRRVTNGEIADLLDQIADLLELENESPFRVRSYRRAAETVRAYPEELINLHAAGKLTTVPGIGESLAQKIAEYIETGSLQYLENLRAKYPDGVLEMLKIPGFGPRSAARVFQELGITTVDELEEAARQGRLRQLPGFGAKSEEKLLHNIALYRQAAERGLLAEVLPIAEALVAKLRAMPEVKECEMAGSVRRKRETVGDLDILAISTDPPKICAEFQRFDELQEIIGAGDTKVSARLVGGRQVDLRVVEEDSYGAALQYFTGSKQHNIALRERANRMGLTVNEYGVFVEQGERKGEKVAGRTEEEVYAALGLPWIPPELRENHGEIEAAEKGQLPKLIELSDIKGDLQMHTRYSDGHHSVEEMAEAARVLGYSYIGITDHSPTLQVAHGMTVDDIKRQHEEIHELNERYKQEGAKFTVLHGIEADILSEGTVDLPEEVIDLFDYVIGSIHQGFSPDVERMTARMIAGIESGLIDIVAHPTGRVLLGRDAYGLDIDEVIQAAAKNDVALEINAFPNRLDLSDVNARRARDRGCKLSINTDAHDVAHLQFMQYGVYTARRGWIEAPNVINTWSLQKLRSWLRKRRQ
ncbi:MAG: DNA polymerase/3'-5' exonuclease PolX [Armatimonadetes bacterium]|nr:DNA polymerase/3'-5' exonuclease PolX [Armatimonadota bacterium]